MSSERFPVTVLGAKMLKDELHHLKTNDRPDVIQAIAEARAQGDLSENADYDAAKERQGFVEGRIKELEYKTSKMQIIDPTKLNAGDRVVFGSKAILENLETQEESSYWVVGEDEADVKENKISHISPMARAIIGKHVGEEVLVNTPSGSNTFEIVDVVYQE